MGEYAGSVVGLETILSSIHEGLLAVDREGRVTIFNQAAVRIMGKCAREVIGRRVEEVIPNTRLHLVLKTGRTELNQIQHVGQTTILTNRVPLFDGKGCVVGAVAVFRGVSELRALAEEVTNLRETRTLLQAIINATSDAISVVDERGMGIMVDPAYTSGIPTFLPGVI